MKSGSKLLIAGYLIGVGGILLLITEPDPRRAALVGWLLCAVIEATLTKRRFRVLSPEQSAEAFAVVLAGGFLVKLMALAGIGLLAHFMSLFPPKPYLFAFLAALVWGETISLVLLSRFLVRRDKAKRFSEDP